MKTETCKLYSRDIWIFLPNIIKIDPYNFELYRFKVGPFFLSHSVQVLVCLDEAYSLKPISSEKLDFPALDVVAGRGFVESKSLANEGQRRW